MNRPILAAAALSALAAAFQANGALAQATQVVEDKDVGVRFTIPKDWTWRRRDRDVFVDCAPKLENRPGVPGCYFTVETRKAASGQMVITDADRTKWKSWTSADGMRPIVSTRDLKVAGFPAFEIVARSGREPKAEQTRRVFILMPAQARVVDASFIAMGKGKDEYPRYNPAFGAALETLAPKK